MIPIQKYEKLGLLFIYLRIWTSIFLGFYLYIIKIAALKLKVHCAFIPYVLIQCLCHTLCWLLEIKGWTKKEMIWCYGALSLLGKRGFNQATE